MNEEIKNQIAEVIKEELLKRGISVELSVEEKKYGTLFTSTDFQTTPVLFKRNYIESLVTIGGANEKGISTIYISVSLKYELFEGGSNGARLFDIICGLNNSNNRIWKEYIK